MGSFLFCSVRGGGRGSPRRHGRGRIGFESKIPHGGLVSRTGGGLRGREGVFWFFLDGAKYFFSGPK